MFRVPTSGRARDNAFVVEGDDGLTLVDVGWASAPRVIWRALVEHGRCLRELRRIVITHAHPDHVRGLATLRAQCDAAIYIHRADADWLAHGRVPVGGRRSALTTLADRLPVLQWAPVRPDALLHDQDLVPGAGGLRVIHTPGHTEGHVALFHEPTRTVLVGDALWHRRGRVVVAPALLAQAPRRARSTLAALPLEAEAVGFAHGAPLTGHHVSGYHETVISEGRA